MQPKRREPEKRHQYWRILSLRRKADRDELQKLLLATETLSLGAHSLLDYLLRPSAGKKTRMCRTVVIEGDYFDEDFVASLAYFYSKGFRDMSKVCERLHFFSCGVDLADLEAMDRLRDSYLGNCVLRPLDTGRIGRTVLRPQRTDPEVDFPTCCGEFRMNIAGAELTIPALPFMEQDGRVQTCSSVAMWIATTALSYRFDLPRYTTTEIMERATKTLVGIRAGPTQGLNYEQMMIALRDMGYDPIMFSETGRLEASYRIYSYIESGIPAILLIQLPNGGNHALVATGHGHTRPLEPGWKLSMSRLGKEVLSYFRSSEWVPYFSVHDDQRGIWRKLSFIEPDPTHIESQIREAYNDTFYPQTVNVDLREWHCPVCIDIDLPVPHIPKKEIANLWGLIVPLPRGITLSHREAESKCVWMIRFCCDRLGLAIPKDPVLRTYLARSNDYKTRLGKSKDMDWWTRGFYRGKPLPKWIWITEISTVELMNATKKDQIRITGELILDASSNPWSADFLAFHLIGEDGNGRVASMLRTDTDVADALATWWSGSEEPYRPLIR